MKTYNIYKTKWGIGAIVFDDKKLFKIFFPEKNKKTMLEKLTENFGEVSCCTDIGNDICLKLERYFRGEMITFDVAISHLESSQFEKTVYKELMKVPFGKTITYKKLAECCGNPNAARAVGNVMAKNPLPIIIPCHRVLKSDGSVGGWSGREGWKERLLQIEGYLK